MGLIGYNLGCQKKLEIITNCLMIKLPLAQTQSLTCHDACQKVVWRVGQSRVDTAARDRAMELCDQSPELLHCLRDLTASTVHADTSKCKNN